MASFPQELQRLGHVHLSPRRLPGLCSYRSGDTESWGRCIRCVWQGQKGRGGQPCSLAPGRRRHETPPSRAGWTVGARCFHRMLTVGLKGLTSSYPGSEEPSSKSGPRAGGGNLRFLFPEAKSYTSISIHVLENSVQLCFPLNSLNVFFLKPKTSRSREVTTNVYIIV